MSVSIVVPLYNEHDNVRPLYEQLVGVLAGLDRPWEIVFVDDGSNDGTDRQVEEIARDDRRVKLVQLRRNFGQSAALQAGIGQAQGEVIVTIDGDLQNDPADVPMILDKLDEGYDVVHGWRKDRKDPWLSRRVPSKIANWIISRTTGFAVHDLGCTLKAIRRPFARELELYGEMHRFIPILAHWQGARCAEVVTRHHPRRHGKSKYGIGRTVRVVLDLITVKFMLDYFSSPMKLFGMIGLGCGVLSGLALAATIAMKLGGGVDMTGNPLLLLSVFAALVAMQFLSLGLLGEFSTRIYYGCEGRQNYAVRRLVNFDSAHAADPDAGHDQSLDPGQPQRGDSPERRAA